MHNKSQSKNLQHFMQRKPIKVVAVCSGKGGVGKTNVASNIAVALSADSINTCLLDADVSLANVDVLLGLQPRFNLSHVIQGKVDLESTILRGPNDLRIVPAASGNMLLADMPPASQAAIVNAFSELTDKPDIMVVDTASGISSGVARFVQAAHHAIVVVCDEPASLTDAYALIKVFSQNYGINHFQIISNQSRKPGAGRALFRKLTTVTDRFLDVVLYHLGDVPQDEYLVKAVQQQKAVVDAYPKSASGEAFTELARKIDRLPSQSGVSGGIEFFFEHLLQSETGLKGKVA